MARRLALEPEGPPIRVILAPEDSPLATNVPPWISGYAYPEVGSLVILVERVPRYPARSLGDVLRHEIAHVLIGRAAGGAPVPRWLHEGLAMALEGRWGVRDAARFELSRLRLRRVDLQGLDEAFRGDAAATAAAYATAGAFYRDLERRHGSAFAPALLSRLAEGRDFDDAFHMLTGRTPQQSLARFSSLEATWVRWVPFLTSPTVLWIAVTLLALWAIKRRRDRDKEIQDQWLAEELAQSETEVRARERWLEQHRLTGEDARSRYRRDGDGEWIN